MENDVVIKVENVTKGFKTYENGKGPLGMLRRKFYWKKALKGISFSIKKGEVVALLGRNGSGKSTMIKLMSGVLYPDTGNVTVLGFDPWKDRIKLAMKIGVVFGATHPQLFWDLPPIDTFNYVKGLYGISDQDYKSRLKEMLGLLSIERVYKRQTRQLSLGERMKCEFTAAMLNMPDVVFMDEPTIGVDLPSRIAIGKAILSLRQRFGTTFIITTHVVDDISNTDRIILLDKGRLLFDGTQHELKAKFGKYAVLELYSKAGNYLKRYSKLGKVVEDKEGYLRLAVNPRITKEKSFTAIFGDPKISDYRLSEPGLSAILESTYSSIDRKKKPTAD